MAIINRKADGSGGIFGAQADTSATVATNHVDGQSPLPHDPPAYNQPTALTNDQSSLGTAPERQNLENHYRAAQTAASRIGADAGAGGTVVAAAGSAVVGQIPDGTQGDLIGSESPLVTRADGGDDLSQSAYGKAI